MLSVAFFIAMRYVVMLSAIRLNVVVPIFSVFAKPFFKMPVVENIKCCHVEQSVLIHFRPKA
jgi:hypothetical protein